MADSSLKALNHIIIIFLTTSAVRMHDDVALIQKGAGLAARKLRPMRPRTDAVFLRRQHGDAFNGRAVREGKPCRSLSPVRQPAWFRPPAWRLGAEIQTAS